MSGENLGDAKWLEELRGDAVLRDVRGFNVGVQAVASLHKELLKALPPWYDVDDLANEGEVGLPLQQLSDEQQAQAARKKRASQPQEPPEAVPVQKVEEQQAEMMLQPKDLLASERTMLEWMHTVFALAVMAIGDTSEADICKP